MQEAILAVLLAVAGALVVIGVAMWSTAAGFVAGGAMLAAWSWMVLDEVDG